MKHNVYFDGAIQSLRYTNGEREVSVGVMSPGTYHFSSEVAERVEVLSGCLEFSLDSVISKRLVISGEAYDVPPETSFCVSCNESVAYICYFAGK